MTGDAQNRSVLWFHLELRPVSGSFNYKLHSVIDKECLIVLLSI